VISDVPACKRQLKSAVASCKIKYLYYAREKPHISSPEISSGNLPVDEALLARKGDSLTTIVHNMWGP
jgi:hypothetical protein